MPKKKKNRHTFSNWLIDQRRREDEVGALARWRFLEAENWPDQIKNVAHGERYLARAGAPKSVVAALPGAFSEWEERIAWERLARRS